ncbi:hypothetical protein TYRP_023505, partial [Tyrophagus putrescentiae]
FDATFGKESTQEKIFEYVCHFVKNSDSTFLVYATPSTIRRTPSDMLTKVLKTTVASKKEAFLAVKKATNNRVTASTNKNNTSLCASQVDSQQIGSKNKHFNSSTPSTTAHTSHHSTPTRHFWTPTKHHWSHTGATAGQHSTNLCGFGEGGFFDGDEGNQQPPNCLHQQKQHQLAFTRAVQVNTEQSGRKNLTTTFSDKGGIVVTTLNGNKVHLKKIVDLRPKMYKFDAVFSEKSTQEEVFTSVCPFVENYLSGSDSTLLVYGRSGSGKSFRQKGFFLKKFSKNFFLGLPLQP